MQPNRRSSWIVVLDDFGYDDMGMDAHRNSGSEDDDVADHESADDDAEEDSIPLLKQKIRLLQRNNTAFANETDRQRDEISELKRQLGRGSMDYSSSRRH
ncbi:unknown protein [Seminavis robusta]|uniref:Uncharacterized protein n=1 Tax=Seminavis robusta TaxID=568900 RepID=A0A9N8EM68_9STRA|nr:unknown protein [Seminavis robusta]|eukprot:Sro1209_g252700.1 n/a (100) ;mRNA; r:31472-31771